MMVMLNANTEIFHNSPTPLNMAVIGVVDHESVLGALALTTKGIYVRLNAGVTTSLPQPETAYEHGYAAYGENGSRITDNPHAYGTIGYRYWDKGFRAALSEDETYQDDIDDLAMEDE